MGSFAFGLLAVMALLASGSFMHLAGILTARSESPTGTSVLLLLVGFAFLGAAWWIA